MPALMSGVIPAPGYGVQAAVGSSLPPVVPPALSPYLLDQDQAPFKSPTGAGPGGEWPQQAVPESVSRTVIPWQEAELQSPVTDEFYSNPGFIQGPWPWSDEPGEAYGVVPDDGLSTDTYPIANKQFTGAWERNILSPGSNLISQQTTTSGWEVNDPSGRTAVRRLIGQSYPGVDPFWWDANPLPSRNRSIMTGQPVNGQLAEFGGVYNAGGNLALGQPAPPATSDISQVPSGATGPDWQWGSF